jgi:hypothetical protein
MPILKPIKKTTQVKKTQKKPAIKFETRNSILKQSSTLKKFKIQVSQMKLGLLAVGGKFPELNRHYSRLIVLDANLSEAIYQLREVKDGTKRSESIEKFEKELVEFQKKVKEKKRFVERAVGNKVDSINTYFKQLENIDLKKISLKELRALGDKAGKYNREYSRIRDVFKGNIDFTGPGGIDYSFKRQEHFFEKYNRALNSHRR